LALILVIGAYLRLSHIDWDEGAHIHPDERFLTMVTDAVDLPASFGEFIDSTRSPLSPYNKGYGFFVYGTLPLFIVRVAAEFLNRLNQETQWWTVVEGVPLDLIGYGGVHFVGRALSGLFDLACIPLIYVISRRLYDWRVGLLAGAFYAFAVLPLQQSHFYTVDTFGAFFALLTFYFAVRVLQGGQRGGGGWGSYLAMGASLGATLASRINLAPLAGIVLLAAAVRAWDDWHIALAHVEDPRQGDEGRIRDGAWLSTLIQATLFRLLVMGLVTVAVFRILQPYAFGGQSLLDFSFAEQWRDNMRQIRLLIGGDADYPPGHQWASRTPFVFPFVNMVVWGLGVPLGLTAWAAWAVATWQVIRGLTVRADGRAVRAHILPVAWIGGMFLWQGLQYVQSMRYLLPIYPVLAMMAAWLLWLLVDKARGRSSIEGAAAGRATSSRSLTGLAYALLAGVTIATMLWGWGFLAIYRRPLSRITASRWIYENVPPGSVIANEHWDDGLPLRVDGKDGFGSFGYRGLSISGDGNMQMYNEDTPEKREQLYQWLNEADYIVLSSNRLWGSIPRLPLRYPMTTRYYELLFEGKLGFDPVQRFTSFPTIFGVEFDDTGAEEAFSVYDHPEVRIFKKTSEYSEALARSYLDPIDLEHTIQYWPKQVSAAPTALLMSEADAARQQAGGTWAAMFDGGGIANRSPWVSVLLWLAAVEVLGLLAFPLCFALSKIPERGLHRSKVSGSGLSDGGYGVSKVVGLLLLAWLSWVLPSLRIAPFTRLTIFISFGVLALASVLVGWRNRDSLLAFVRGRARLLAVQELLFLALFALFLAIRWGNPDLWHPARGGEKPMDFAYLNAVLKSTYFPPYDPWFAGGSINYYYFGFVIIAVLTKLTGIVPWVAYNLAVPTLFALTGLGAFSAAYNLAGGDGEVVSDARAEDHGGLSLAPLGAGFAGALFAVLIGNLGNVRLLLGQMAAAAPPSADLDGPLWRIRLVLSGMANVLAGNTTLNFPNDWWFWNASRVIPETINEFPFFTFVYADLHAHMIAFPIVLLGLVLATALVRNASPSALLDAQAGVAPPQVLAGGWEGRLGPWYIRLPDLALLVALGFTAGVLRATNTWDFPTAIIVGLIGIVLHEAARAAQQGVLDRGLDDRLIFLFHRAVAVVWKAIILLAAAMLASYPFGAHYATAYTGLERWSGQRTLLADYFVVYGFFLLVALIYLLSELRDQVRLRRVPDGLADLAPAIAGAVVVGIGAGWVLGARIWLVALPLAVLAATLAAGKALPLVRRFALLLLALAFAINLGVEVIRLQDDIGRMNTVFKFYLQAWLLLSVTCAYGLAIWAKRAAAWRAAERRRSPIGGWSRVTEGLAWTALAVVFVGVLIYPPTAARAKIRDRFSAEASPRGLDGMAYMDRAQYFDMDRDMRLADDKAAMLWMLRNVPGSPVILEGNTPGYRWGNRFSIYTGLPAVMGWDWHQKQQRSVVPGAAIDKRLSDVQEIYNTTDLERARKLLNHYNVSYIVLGELERAYYSPEGLAKFDAMAEQGYLEQVYPQDGGREAPVRIFRVADRRVALVAPPPSNVGPQPVPTPSLAPVSPGDRTLDRAPQD
jgi:YYY domain-containing protein